MHREDAQQHSSTALSAPYPPRSGSGCACQRGLPFRRGRLARRAWATVTVGWPLSSVWALGPHGQVSIRSALQYARRVLRALTF